MPLSQPFLTEVTLTMPLRELLSRLKRSGVFIDVKSAFDRTAISEAGFRMWRL